MKRILVTLTAATVLAGAASASIPRRPEGVTGALREAARDGKLVVAAFCPTSAAYCSEYLSRFREASRSVLFQQWAVFVAPDVTADDAAARLAQDYGVRRDPTVMVFGSDARLLWQSIGMAPPDKIARSLEQGVCAATVNRAPQIPAGFTERHGNDCRKVAKGITWYPEPVVIRAGK